MDVAMQCPVCGADDLLRAIVVDKLPVLCNEVYADFGLARSAATGRFHGCWCRDCGHFFNAAFDQRKVQYDQAYDSSLDFSPRFVAFEDELTRRLSATYDLGGKLIVDVGCGKGGFLIRLCAASDAKGIGFDKSFEPRPDEVPGVRFVRDWFDRAYTGDPPDLVTCRHVLEHIVEPVAFLRALKDQPSIRPDTVFYFEVPNALYTLRDLGIWDLIYDHVSYFTPTSFRKAVELAGFEVKNDRATFGDQFIFVEAVPAIEQKHALWSDLSSIENKVGEFASAYHSKIDLWRDYICRRGPRAVALWGAGSKGINFLNVVPGASGIDAIVDLNPHKQGHFAPGTGTPILSPANLAERHVESIVVMNPLYYQEVVTMVSGLHRELEISQA